jgi:hydroxypyruvate isomerase
VADAQERLESAGVPLRNNLHPYECEALDWDADQLHCTNCSAALKELPLQAAALPGLVRELRERYETDTDYGDAVPRIKRLRVVEVVPKRQVKNEAELEEALEALRGAAAQALSEADAVELQ